MRARDIWSLVSLCVVWDSTIVTAIFAITTISYDEFDNGLAFLMTLPVTRKQYVAEKYLLGAGLTLSLIHIYCY